MRRAARLLLGPGLLLLSGCGFALTHGPPPGHQTMASYQCTESNVGPVLDLLVAGVGALVFVAGTQVNEDDFIFNDPAPFLVTGALMTVGWGSSGFVGFGKTARCRDARRSSAAMARRLPVQ